jgi:hypothetical protein
VLTPVSEAVHTPEIVEVAQVAAKETEMVMAVFSDIDDRPHQSSPVPESESTPLEPNLKPKPTQEEMTDDPDPLATAATDDDEIVSAPRKIGIQHILLVYETVGETLQCRMCLYGPLPLVHPDITDLLGCSGSGSVK